MIAEKFETLVTVAALARRFQRGNVGEGGRQQRGIGEFVPDPRLDRRGRRLGADLAALLFATVVQWLASGGELIRLTVRSGYPVLLRRSSHD